MVDWCSCGWRDRDALGLPLGATATGEVDCCTTVARTASMPRGGVVTTACVSVRCSCEVSERMVGCVVCSVCMGPALAQI